MNGFSCMHDNYSLEAQHGQVTAHQIHLIICNGKDRVSTVPASSML